MQYKIFVDIFTCYYLPLIIYSRQFLSEQQIQTILLEHGFKIKSLKSYREKLYTDYERKRKNRARKANYLTEVIAYK